MYFQVNADCIMCNTCTTFCPTNAIQRGNIGYYIEPELCKKCGLCADKCPAEAIDCFKNDGLRPGIVRYPSPMLPEPQTKQDFRNQGFVDAECHQHFLPGVSARMLDWFWCNLDKCYY